MTVRIDTESDGPETVVTVAGRLVGAGASELLKTCRAIQGELVLDLNGLRSADAEGIEAVRQLVQAGRKLCGASPFIRLLLDDQPPAEADQEDRP